MLDTMQAYSIVLHAKLACADRHIPQGFIQFSGSGHIDSVVCMGVRAQHSNICRLTNYLGIM